MIAAARVAARVITTAAGQIFAEPVRSGRITLRGWSRPLQVTIIASLVLYAVLTVHVLLSGPLRHLNPNADLVGLSVWAWPAVGVALWASMALLFLATLHLGILFRLACWLLMLVPHLTLAGGTFFALASFVQLGSLGLLVLLLALVTTVAGGVALLVLVLTRSGRPVTTSTLIIAPLGLAGTYLLPLLGVGAVSTTGASEVSRASLAAPGITMMVLMVVALPLAVAAGTAFAQVSINACTWAFLSLRREIAGRAWAPLAIVLAIAVLSQSLINIWRLDLGLRGFLLPAAQAAMCFLLAGVGLTQARQIGEFMVPRPTALADELGHVSMRLGLLLGSWLLPAILNVVLPLPAWLDNHTSEAADFLMAVVAAGWAISAARRGQAVLATLLPPVAVTGAYAGARTLFDLPTLHNSVSNLVIIVVLVITALTWARRGGLGPDRWFLLALGLLIALVFPWREQVAEPLAALLGFSAVGVLLFGLIWRLLSDAEFTRVESARFPGDARILAFLSYAIFGAAAMVAVAYSTPGTPITIVDLDSLAGIGDAIIGFGLSIAVVVGLIELGRYGVDPDPDEEERD